jgi:hypothetical protein
MKYGKIKPKMQKSDIYTIGVPLEWSLEFQGIA